MTVISREFGVLLPKWDSALLNNLTDIYDGLTVEQKRGQGPQDQDRQPPDQPPRGLHPQLPQRDHALRRVGPGLHLQVPPRSTRATAPRGPLRRRGSGLRHDVLHDDLLHDLKTIAATYGRLAFAAEAAAAIQAWVASDCKPAPDHMRLQSYNARRLSHLLKLCMVAALSRHSNMVISLDDYAEAFNWLLEAEAHMPDIFKAMVQGGDSVAMEEAWNYVWTVFSKEKRPVAEHRVVHFLRERVPPTT